MARRFWRPRKSRQKRQRDDILRALPSSAQAIALSVLLGACSSVSTVTDSPGSSSLLAKLEQSRKAWEALVAKQGETYHYTEENCRVNAPDAEVVAIQVEDGRARTIGSSSIPRSECLALVNAFDDFRAETLSALYSECEQLIRSAGAEVDLVLDERGLLRGCSWPGPGDSVCVDNCGEGFYLRSLEFGLAAGS